MFDHHLTTESAEVSHLPERAPELQASERSEIQTAPDHRVDAVKQNGAPCNTFEMVQSTQRGLSPQKIKALSLLLLGATDHFVASEIGVSRSTVWRWCKRDAVFIAEWNRWIDQLSHASGARMAGLLSRAMDEVGRQMGSRRARTRFRAASLIIRIGSRRLPAMPTLQQLDPEQVAASLVKSGVDVRDLEPLEQETTDEHG